MKFLGIVPARGGSKGIPRKNLVSLCGKSLLQRTLEGALESHAMTDLVVSTDDDEILGASESLGVLGIARPTELADDFAPTIVVVQHGLAEMERRRGERYDAVVLLQPTSPLRKASDIRKAVDLYQAEPNQESLISCYDGTGFHPEIMYKKKGASLTRYLKDKGAPKRRQDFEPVFIRNGALYITSRRLIMEESSLYTDTPLLYEMSLERSVNIDSPKDLILAEFYLKH